MWGLPKIPTLKPNASVMVFGSKPLGGGEIITEEPS